MIVIVLLWLCLVAWGLKYSKTAGTVAFDKNTSLALRGICAVEIMIGHLGIATKSAVLYPNRKAGILFVGIFFALSGYGLMYSLWNKEGYLDRFLLKRLSTLLIPAYVIYLIGVLLVNPYNFLDIFRVDFFFTETNWYVWEQLAMYTAFYICARFMDIKKSHVILFVLSFIFVCVAFAVKLERPWYGSTFCFWLGIFYFIKKDEVRELLVLKRWILNIFILGLFMIVGMGLFFIKEDWIAGDLVGRNIASLSFVIVVIICLYRFKLGNKVSLWLGDFSYEIFLFHPIFIKILRPYIGMMSFLALLLLRQRFLSHLYITDVQALSDSA